MARFEAPLPDGSTLAAPDASPDALYQLGLMYAAGRDVAVDLVTAHMWLNIAAARGNLEARRMRTELADAMTRDEIMRAQRQARAWITRH
jgi:uncharacterized protein